MSWLLLMDLQSLNLFKDHQCVSRDDGFFKNDISGFEYTFLNKLCLFYPLTYLLFIREVGIGHEGPV